MKEYGKKLAELEYKLDTEKLTDNERKDLIKQINDTRKQMMARQ